MIGEKILSETWFERKIQSDEWLVPPFATLDTKCISRVNTSVIVFDYNICPTLILETILGEML